MSDIFLCDEEESPRASNGGGIANAAILATLKGVQLLLSEILGAINSIRDDRSDNRSAAATRTLHSGDPSKTCKVTTQFDRSQPFTVAADVDTPGVFAQMTVQWHCDGVIVQRTIDVCAGASISGYGHTVTATVVDNTTVGRYAANKTPTDYNVTVTVGRGTRTSILPCVQTGLQATTLNAGANVSVNVPNGANGYIIIGESGGQPAVMQVDQLTPTPVIGAAVKLAGEAINNSPGQARPLVAGVGQLQITNSSAGQASVTVIFTIDG